MEEKQNFQTSLDFSQNIFKPSTREEIVEIVKNCYKKSIPLEISGLQSKNRIGRNFQAEKTLDLSNYKGIIDYKPEELYIKVKAGTPISEIEKALKKNNQQLAFEPNDFGYLFSGESNSGSIGGVVPGSGGRSKKKTSRRSRMDLTSRSYGETDVGIEPQVSLIIPSSLA